MAAESSGDFVAAAIDRPGDGEWAAAGGGGLTGSGEVVGLTTPSDLRQALIGVGFPYDLDLRTQALSSLARLIPAIRDFRRIGSAACDTLALVQGRLHAFVGFGLAEWDTAAARAIIPAAGGVCADVTTARGLGAFIAGTVGVVDAVVDVLRRLKRVLRRDLSAARDGLEMDEVRTALRRAAALRESGLLEEAGVSQSDLDGGRPDVAYQLAWALDCLGRDHEAITHYRQALRRNADPAVAGRLPRDEHHGAFLGLALVLLRTDRADLAVDVLTSASSYFRQSEQVSGLLAVALIGLPRSGS